MNKKIETAIPLIPHLPGVYLMKDKDDKVIYVGKAKDLYKRVSQYFLREQFNKVRLMVENVDHFETIITKSEKEAFLLEENLIHQYYPRFNILLKDGKHYPYIALKKDDPYLRIARNDKDKKYDYFGPFPTSSYAYNVINLLNKLFKTRKCKNIPSSPCIYYHLNQCLAPCINKISADDNTKLVNDIKAFLEGRDDSILKQLEKEMLKNSENEEYEKAFENKKMIDSIHHILDKQVVENKDHVSRDIFSFATRDNYLSLAILTLRNGILLGKDVYIVEEFGELEEQIADLILQYYQNHPLPKEIVINLPSIKETIIDIYDVDVITSSRGKLFDLIEMASLNAKQELDAHFMSARLEDNNLALLEELGSLINIKTPYRIELFDNSHLQGDASVGAVVVFINALPVKRLYRKFNIEGYEKRDDYSSMKEIVKRRYSRLKEEKLEMPDLILTDGGLGQVHAALEALKEIDVDIPVFGLFKNDKHSTSGLITKDGNVIDINNKALFFLLVRMQDEVHRFAISFHHQKRRKNFNVGLLDDIPGLGNKRKELIKSRYKSIDELLNASLEELSQFMPSDVAKLLIKKLEQYKS